MSRSSGLASSVGGAGLWAMTTAMSGPPQMMGFLTSRKLGSPKVTEMEHIGERGKRRREGRKRKDEGGEMVRNRKAEVEGGYQETQRDLWGDRKRCEARETFTGE